MIVETKIFVPMIACRADLHGREEFDNYCETILLCRTGRAIMAVDGQMAPQRREIQKLPRSLCTLPKLRVGAIALGDVANASPSSH